MTFANGRRSRRARAALWLVACACMLVAATCSGFRPGVPRQGWDEARFGPLVPHESFPADCSLCHLPDGWDELRADFAFDHEAQTGVPLAGAHADAACLRCHNDFGPVAAFVARGCQGCHVDVHRGQLGTTCTECHDEQSWRPGGLVAEHARTRFPLVGAHIAVACELCHERAPTGDFRGAPTDCAACHRADALAATSPDHVAQGWTAACERCHFPTTWSGGFQHDFFPLAGGHAGLDCSRCHTGGVPGPIPADCASCHEDDYQRAPNHVSSNFSRSCERCHSIQSWEGATVDHSFFPLAGGHAGLDCSRCHTGTPGPIPADCVSCHRDDYQSAPNHVSLGFPERCEDCHTTQRWTGAVFDHRFPLRGPHDVDCQTCHTGGDTRQFSCLVCHEHNQADTDDDHDEVSGYRYESAACLSCHPDGND